MVVNKSLIKLLISLGIESFWNTILQLHVAVNLVVEANSLVKGRLYSNFFCEFSETICDKFDKRTYGKYMLIYSTKSP